MATRQPARWAFIVLATLVALMGFNHLFRAFGGAPDPGQPVWYHPVIGVLYLLAAVGLLLRPRWFVVFFGLVTLYAVLAGIVMAWRSATGANPFDAQLAAGFIVFPIALNLLLADTIHERIEEVAEPVPRREPRKGVPS